MYVLYKFLILIDGQKILQELRIFNWRDFNLA